MQQSVQLLISSMFLQPRRRSLVAAQKSYDVWHFLFLFVFSVVSNFQYLINQVFTDYEEKSRENGKFVHSLSLSLAFPNLQSNFKISQNFGFLYAILTFSLTSMFLDRFASFFHQTRGIEGYPFKIFTQNPKIFDFSFKFYPFLWQTSWTALKNLVFYLFLCEGVHCIFLLADAILSSGNSPPVRTQQAF